MYRRCLVGEDGLIEWIGLRCAREFKLEFDKNRGCAYHRLIENPLAITVLMAIDPVTLADFMPLNKKLTG
jgi:hypothetical protein